MDRSSWIQEKRRRSEERTDIEWAPIYDEKWGAIAPAHKQFFIQFLGLCPPNSLILDAACGTGKYWPLILTNGHTIFGTDQSKGMLAVAHMKFPGVPIEKIGMQEMAYQEAFDSAACVDAMESVFPEDWPVVLRNFYRAIRPGGYLYFTVETIPEQELEQAFAEGQRQGLPIVYGEWAPEDRYHFYPKIDQVKQWVQQAGFHLLHEIEGDDYHHFLVQKP